MPKTILILIDELNVFVTSLDAAAGISSMLKTSIMPTVVRKLLCLQIKVS